MKNKYILLALMPFVMQSGLYASFESAKELVQNYSNALASYILELDESGDSYTCYCQSEMLRETNKLLNIITAKEQLGFIFGRLLATNTKLDDFAKEKNLKSELSYVVEARTAVKKALLNMP